MLGAIVGLLCWSSCKRTRYTCAAYTSAFVLDLPTYKRSAAQDSMEKGADTNLDVDIVAVLADRIRRVPAIKYEFDGDSTPIFPPSGVIKTNVLLIKKISRRRKDKLMASVPMITVFPSSPDSTDKEADSGTKRQGLPTKETERSEEAEPEAIPKKDPPEEPKN